ncbi:MAG: 50S ribosomal protein L20 [Planctomycetota bacterium]|nr:MAG: 50S ribosomal protein L20 [Planctomycetota bacterium]
MRVRYGKARHRKKKRLFREAKGNVGGRSKLLRTVKETIVRSRAYAYRDRRRRKRDFRRLWIIRIAAACGAHDLSYSRFINLLKKANIGLNRKMLSELAIHEPEVFAEIVRIAQS